MEPNQDRTTEQERPEAPPKGTTSDDLNRTDRAVDLVSFTEWARENKTVALLGAFAAGVFIGVMMRS